MQDYEEKVKELRYKRVTSFNKGNLGGFKVKEQPKKSPPKDEEVYDKLFENEQQDSGPPEFDVPIRRFEIINKKIKSFPLLEKDGNVRIMDFGDGFGAVYAYRWKNDPNQGWVSYWAQFENPENISIDKDSTISSNSYLFAKNGNINIIKTAIINTQIWAEGEIKINKCESIKDCYIFGALTLDETPLASRNRFFTQSCTLKKCKISGNNLFFQDKIDSSGTINLNETSISGNCEIIGSVSIQKATISDKVRISGKVTIDKTTTISDKVYINSGRTGSISIASNVTISDNAIIINNAKIGPNCTISDSAFIGDNASINKTKVSDKAVILDNANLNNCSVSDKSIINMKSSATNTNFSDNAIMTGSTTANNTKISGDGILAGNATKVSSAISDQGRVFDNQTCPHNVSDNHRHWDKRSCDFQIDFLKDEREGCVAPDAGDCDKFMPPPTIC